MPFGPNTNKQENKLVFKKKQNEISGLIGKYTNIARLETKSFSNGLAFEKKQVKQNTF